MDVGEISYWVLVGLFAILCLFGGGYMLFDIRHGSEYRYYKNSLRVFNNADSLRLPCNEAIKLVTLDGINVHLWGDDERGWFYKVGIYSSSDECLGVFSFTSAMEALKFNQKIKRTLLKERNLDKKREMYERIRKELDK